MRKIVLILCLCVGVVVYGGFSARPKPAVTERASPDSRAVAVRTLSNGHYQLFVDNKPYIIKGVCYNSVEIGNTQGDGFWHDPREPWKVDGALMKKMGINTVRFYQPGDDPVATKKVINDLYSLYGIRTILGHWVGFWNYPAPFYADEEFRETVKADVLAMVREYKDEPGILMWVLGNENNYSFACRVNAWSSDEIDAMDDPLEQINARARIYYSFINELAVAIHAIDPQHPVALGNGELKTLDIANEVCQEVDILACIIYRGKSFGNIFNNLRLLYDKPIVLIEFGCDAYDAYNKTEDQDVQAKFLKSQWREMYKNLANNPEGAGNCLGGTMFEWADEWWKYRDYDPRGWSIHNTESDWSNGAYYFDIKVAGHKNMNEEWFGLVGLSAEEGQDALSKRVPRKSYYVIREFWKDPQEKE